MKIALPLSVALLFIMSPLSHSTSASERMEEAAENRADRLEDKADQIKNTNKNAGTNE